MKYQDFKTLINKPFFRKSDLDLWGIKIYRNQLFLWCKKDYIKRLKNSLYVFSDSINNLDSHTVSFLMYEPSYISLESALRYYGLIPEIVQSVTAITTKTTRSFDNYYGRFIYRHVKSDLFWGYNPIGNKYGKHLFAEPEKAILDYIYFNQSVLNNIGDIEELRLNVEEFKSVIEIKKLKKYLKIFNIKKMDKIVELLLKYINS